MKRRSYSFMKGSEIAALAALIRRIWSDITQIVRAAAGQVAAAEAGRCRSE